MLSSRQPLLSFDLAVEAEALRSAPPWWLRGHNAKTLVERPDHRLLLIVLKAGARTQQHHTDQQISFQTIVGRVRLNLPDQSVDLRTGSVLVLDKAIPHDLVADEDSTVLLSLSGVVTTDGDADEVDQLLVEHQRFLQLLVLVEQELVEFHAGARPDYELLRDIFYYMTTHADRFHHPREDLVFAKVAERVASARAHVAELRKQHRLIAESGALFLGNLEAALSGTILLRDSVEEPALRYIALYREHLALEQEYLFPLARTVLNEADWAEAKAAIGTEPDPVFGDLIEDGYHALHRQIALDAGCTCTHCAADEVSST